MGDLKLWTNDTDTYVARDVAHVLELYEVCVGEPYDPENGEWTEREDRGAFTIHLDDGRGTVTQTPSEWIAENGPGFLCSTEY